MQRDCALSIAGRGCLTLFFVEYKTGPVDPRDVIYTKTRLRTLLFGVVPRTKKLDCSGIEPGRMCVFSNESRFNLSSDGNRDRVWRPRGKRSNPAFALQRHTVPTARVMVWGAITYNTRSPLVLIRGAMTVQRVWTLVPVRLGKQLSDNSTVDEIASEAADCPLHTQWRVDLKGGKTTTVGRRGSAGGACVGHLLVCEETGKSLREKLNPCNHPVHHERSLSFPAGSRYSSNPSTCISPQRKGTLAKDRGRGTIVKLW
ncbi:transposable element Tcb2 transposase [Trichonephila clavipes]|nr:transposable element Tcb2 transposase [Trichonephila clavipes]